MRTELKWITPNTDTMIAHMARVSNPSALETDPSEKLIQYLLKHRHFSPFEMACMAISIETTREISRQMLRHRSFHFQEFSQRYSKIEIEPEFAEVRLQDMKNRQNSIVTDDPYLNGFWDRLQRESWKYEYRHYQMALESGIAKESARKLLPEGLTPTIMYMQGTIRDWLHYLSVRMGPETQKEHRDVANSIAQILADNCPIIWQAAQNTGIITQ